MYIIKQNDEIKFVDSDLKRLQNTIALTQPDLRVEDIEEVADDSIEQGYDTKWYQKGQAPVKPLSMQVEELESKTGLNRIQRELILSGTTTVSDYLKNKAQEIEDLAEQAREEHAWDNSEVVAEKEETEEK